MTGQRMTMMMGGGLLTVDADDFDHGESKEWQGLHLHLHQHCSDEKHHQNDGETAGDSQLLRNPERNTEKISNEAF